MDSGFPWWILLIVVVFGIFVYLMLMLFLPEWVGITGKTALENEKSHLEGSIVNETPPKGRMRTMPPPIPTKSEIVVPPVMSPGMSAGGSSGASSGTPMTPSAPITMPPNSPPVLTIVKKSESSSSSEDK